MQTFFVAPTRQNVGLTSVSLGVVRALQHQGLKVGFVKPVSQETQGVERSSHFASQICQIECPKSLSIEHVHARVSAGKNDELLEDIVSLCMGSAQDIDVLVVEGMHLDPSSAFVARLNIEVARSLQAEVILVANARAVGAVAEARLAASQLKNEGCQVAGVIFNKAGPQFDAASVQYELDGIALWGVIKFEAALLAPRTLDIARHLNADVLIEGDIANRRVLETVIAARSVSEVIERLKAGALVVSAGDRDDVMLATALAASQGVQLAGLLLTHSSKPDERILDLARQALTSGIPVLRTDSDSFNTAIRITQLPPAVAEDDCERMNQVLDAVAEQIDMAMLMNAVQVPPSTRMSPPSFRYQLIQKARSIRKTVVLPEGEEPRTIRAAIICEEKGIAHCVLLGKRATIEATAAAQGVSLPASLEILDPDVIRTEYVDAMVELRKSKGLTQGQALQQLEDTVVLGTMMLAVDRVDGLVSGAIHTTASTVRPALQLIKTAPGSSIVSSVFFMLMPEQVLVYGDCAINPNPTAEQLAEIAKQSSDSARAFGVDPKVAMISYSTGISGAGVEVDKVRAATELARSRYPDLVLDGPLQYDAASVSEVAAQKAPSSAVAGKATVFVFPDLNTGNTTYKAVQRSAHVVSVGPMLQGLRKPVNDLSRGALVDDIVFTIALTVIQAQDLAA
ncbi:MAG: phosphate acetyltransferase [Proteobacteria bacterium]|nr:phosphate acetyltransferase [Pseudomonadota bacterium]